MPAMLRLHDVCRKLGRLGCALTQRKGSHWTVERHAGGRVYYSGFSTVHGRYVKAVYRKVLQRELRISREEWDDA